MAKHRSHLIKDWKDRKTKQRMMSSNSLRWPMRFQIWQHAHRLQGWLDSEEGKKVTEPLDKAISSFIAMHEKRNGTKDVVPRDQPTLNASLLEELGGRVVRTREMLGGGQVIVRFPNNAGMSVIQHAASFGLEVMDRPSERTRGLLLEHPNGFVDIPRTWDGDEYGA